MRIMIIKLRADSQYLAALTESLFEKGIAVSLEGDFVKFDVEEITIFLGAVAHVYSEWSRDSRGQEIRRRRFFRVEDYPFIFFYELTTLEDNNGKVALKYGRV